MAGLLNFVLTCLLVTVAYGQTENAMLGGDMMVDGYVWADLFTTETGGVTITQGEITAENLYLSGDLSAGDGTFNSLNADDLRLGDLTAQDASFSGRLTTSGVTVNGNATFDEDLTVLGTLYANLTFLGETRITGDLTVPGETNVQGIIFAQGDAIVAGDINVGENVRITGDLNGAQTLTLEGMLNVKGTGNVESFTVETLSEIQSLTVQGAADFASLDNNMLNIDGSAWIGGPLSSAGSVTVGGDWMAGDVVVTTYSNVGGNATVDGSLTAGSGSFAGDLASAEWVQVDGTLAVQGNAEVGANATVAGDATFGGDLTAGASVAGLVGMFNTLDVDTSSIESLTSTFITAGTLEAQDGTSSRSLVVTGLTTLDTLTVTGSTLLQRDATMDSLTTGELGFGTTTAGALTVTGEAILTTVDVKSTLTVGAPSDTSAPTSIDSVFADDFTILNLMADQGMVDQITGETVTTEYLNGTTSTVEQFTSDWAVLGDVWGATANITMIQGTNASTTALNAVDITTEMLTSSEGTLSDLTSETIFTVMLDANTGDITRAHAQNTDTFLVQALEGELTNLWSTNGTIETLTATNATIDSLSSVNGTIMDLWGDELRYNQGTITDLTTTKHWSDRVRIRDGFDTEILYANYANITNSEFMTLRVTDMAWIQDAWVQEDTQVEGFSTFESGFIAGPTVVAAITVAGDALVSTLDVVGPATLTDLMVKRVTITDSFEANKSMLGWTTIDDLTVDGDVLVGGTLTVLGDTALEANLVVEGTTQFQTGSFTRIGTAIITTTDMEAFNMDVANGLFGAITTDDLTVVRAAVFERSITVAPLRGGTGTYSLYSSIAQTPLTAYYDGVPTPIVASTIFHPGFETVDALVFTSSDDHTQAQLRVTAGGALDFLGGTIAFDTLTIGGGIIFENENNVAWAASSALPTATLTPGLSAPFYRFDDLVDRDMGAPGMMWDPTRFAQPGLPSDLLTLSAGHYRVSGNVVFSFTSGATANSVILAAAGVDGFEGSDSTGANVYRAECVATFNAIAGSQWGGSCFFDDVLVVAAGETVTLRSWAEWRYSSATLANSLRVDARSTLMVEEFFERSSEMLSAM